MIVTRNGDIYYHDFNVAVFFSSGGAPSLFWAEGAARVVVVVPLRRELSAAHRKGMVTAATPFINLYRFSVDPQKKMFFFMAVVLIVSEDKFDFFWLVGCFSSTELLLHAFKRFYSHLYAFERTSTRNKQLIC